LWLGQIAVKWYLGGYVSRKPNKNISMELWRLNMNWLPKLMKSWVFSLQADSNFLYEHLFGDSFSPDYSVFTPIRSADLEKNGVEYTDLSMTSLVRYSTLFPTTQCLGRSHTILDPTTNQCTGTYPWSIKKVIFPKGVGTAANRRHVVKLPFSRNCMVGSSWQKLKFLQFHACPIDGQWIRKCQSKTQQNGTCRYAF